MRKCLLVTVLIALLPMAFVPDSAACGRRGCPCYAPAPYGFCPAWAPAPWPTVYYVPPPPYYPVPYATAVRPTSSTLVSPSGKRYRLIPTNDRGNYENDLPAPAAFAAVPVPNDGEHFRGSARKAAKTSIATGGDPEQFDTLADLLRPLLSREEFSDKTMRAKIAPNSPRVAEEKRNVTVRTFLYATKKETDNDFHLLLGPDPSDPNPSYMTAEVSGLPFPDNQATPKLTKARNQFKGFFSQNSSLLPGTSYVKFDPPVPVIVSGSLFFDIDHQPGDVGTGSIVPQSVWEIHPITDITFEP